MSPKPILFCAIGVHGTVGGIASASGNVLAALKRLADETGREVHTLVLSEEGASSRDYRTFGGDKIAFTLAVLRQARRASLIVFDHIHLAIPILALPKMLRPKVVVFAHGWEAFRFVRPASAKAFRRADRVLTNSHHTLARMAREIGGFDGAVCLLGLPTQFELTPAPPIPSDDKITLEAADGVERDLGDQVFLLVGRLAVEEREKGQRELIAVMPALLNRFPRAQLVFVGSGADREVLAAVARSSPAAANIFLPGRMSSPDLEAMYRKAYAYAMPSRQEGFGLAYLEAMNYAKPCLACHDDGGADVVVDGKTGILISHDVGEDELLAALETLLADPALARQYGEAGWLRLVQTFTSAAHQERVVEHIRPLLTEGKNH